MTQEKDIKIVVDSFANLIDECLEVQELEISSSEIEVTITDEETGKQEIKRYTPKFILEEVKND